LAFEYVKRHHYPELFEQGLKFEGFLQHPKHKQAR
jgi:hypothetical protein